MPLPRGLLPFLGGANVYTLPGAYVRNGGGDGDDADDGGGGPSRVVRYDVRVEPTLTMLKRAGTKARPRDFFVAISREKFNLLNRREGQNSSTQWTAKKRRWKV